jgi:hypothetical protein
MSQMMTLASNLPSSKQHLIQLLMAALTKNHLPLLLLLPPSSLAPTCPQPPTSFNAAKTKNSSNKERGSVLKSIDKLTASMDGGGGGGGGDQSMMSMLAMQMQQNAQSQFMQQQMFQQQFQMQMGQMTKEIKKGNNLTGKLVNAIAKKMSGKKRRKKVDSGDSSSSDGEDSHSSGDD